MEQFVIVGLIVILEAKEKELGRKMFEELMVRFPPALANVGEDINV